MARTLLVRLARWRGAFLCSMVICAITLAAVAPSTFPPVIVLLAVVALVLDVGATLTFQTALALQHTTAWSFRFGVQNTITLAASLAGYEAAGVEGAIAGLAVASGALFAWGSFLVLRPLMRARSGASLPAGAIRFGAVHAVANLFEQVTHRGAVVAVAILAGSSVETGFAALAVGIAMAGAYVIWQLFTAQLPGLVAATRDEPDASLAERSLRQLSALSLGGAFALAAVGVCLIPLVAPVVFGDEFEDAVPAMAIALTMLPLAPLSALSTQTAALRLRPELRARATGAGVSAFAVTAALAVPQWEATGGAVALLAGVAVSVSVSSDDVSGGHRAGSCWPPAMTRLGPAAWARAGHGRGVMPDVSVVVPTRDRPAPLERCLRALSRQTLDTRSRSSWWTTDRGPARWPRSPRSSLGCASSERRAGTPPRRGTREYARPPAESSA